MQLHAKGKPIDRSDDDALLRYVADQAINYSGAELANLLNEAAILMVRWVCVWGGWVCVCARVGWALGRALLSLTPRPPCPPARPRAPQVRKDATGIDFQIMNETLEKLRMGFCRTSLPDTPAKRRLATIGAPLPGRGRAGG